MRLKAIIILVLLCAVFYSMIVGTLSGYTSQSEFSADIIPDTAAIRSQTKKTQENQITGLNTDAATEPGNDLIISQ